MTNGMGSLLEMNGLFGTKPSRRNNPGTAYDKMEIDTDLMIND